MTEETEELLVPIPSPEEASARFRALCTEPFWYDEIDEYSPFGNDDGADIFASLPDLKDAFAVATDLEALEMLCDSWEYLDAPLEDGQPLSAEQQYRAAAFWIWSALAQLYWRGNIDRDLKQKGTQMATKLDKLVRTDAHFAEDRDLLLQRLAAYSKVISAA